LRQLENHIIEFSMLELVAIMQAICKPKGWIEVVGAIPIGGFILKVYIQGKGL
jgi:hypothetical protein|tara:strand:- start:193 stop:351 length:159 start_codon:yes stop_codon:yes gene_type:complete